MKEIIKINKYLCFTAILGLIAAPVFSQAELPVEMDIELLSEEPAGKFDIEAAKAKLAEYIEKMKIGKEYAEKANDVLEKLVEEGVSTEKACEEIKLALKKGEDVEKLVGEFAFEEAKAELTGYAEKMKMGKKDTEKAIKILDKLVEEGVSTERALKEVEFALEKGEDVKSLAKEEFLERIKKEETARIEFKREAEALDIKEADIAVLVEVMEGMIEKGIDVEHARGIVEEAAGKETIPADIKNLITDRGIKEVNAAMKAGAFDIEAILEKVSMDGMKQSGEEEMKKLEESIPTQPTQPN
ncbi:MAG: hypothetical protein HY746_07810 [Elusimicrobia bacterium]|nr:hypothetical protein [Elusimicrobiota bacterium]